jgi:hypothetical protein
MNNEKLNRLISEYADHCVAVSGLERGDKSVQAERTRDRHLESKVALFAATADLFAAHAAARGVIEEIQHRAESYLGAVDA